VSSNTPTAVSVRYREAADDWIVRPPGEQPQPHPSRREAVAEARRTALDLGCLLEVETHAGGVQRRPP
jgi:hypothetical protein